MTTSTTLRRLFSTATPDSAGPSVARTLWLGHAACGGTARPSRNQGTGAILLSIALLLTGCGTLGTANNPALLADLRDMAQVGARIDLLAHPEHRAAYETTIASLDALSRVERLTPVELHTALLNLPIKELRSERAVLYVTAAQILMRRVLDGRDPVAVPAAVRGVAAALRDGLMAAVN